MDINNMTRKEFEQLPIIREDIKEFDSIVILPYKYNDDSGFSVYSVVVCNGLEPLGRLLGYDTFSIYNAVSRVGIDVLAKSKLTRIFFEKNRFTIDTHLHSMEAKIR